MKKYPIFLSFILLFLTIGYLQIENNNYEGLSSGNSSSGLSNFNQKNNIITASIFPGFSNFKNSFYNNLIKERRYLLILTGLQTTIIISFFSVILGSILGALICFFRMSKIKIFNNIAKIYISILRGTPVLVLLMLIFYVIFGSVNINATIVAVLAFGLNFSAYSSEIFRTGIESIDKGQTEAGIAIGFTKVGTFIHIILPQTIRRIIPVLKGEIITLIKMTSIVGYVAVHDLTKASDIIRSRTFDAFFPLVMVAVLYFMLSWFLIITIDYFEKKTNRRLNLKRNN